MHTAQLPLALKMEHFTVTAYDRCSKQELLLETLFRFAFPPPLPSSPIKQAIHML